MILGARPQGDIDAVCPINWLHPINVGRVMMLYTPAGYAGGSRWPDLCRLGDASRHGALTNVAIPATATSGWTATPYGTGVVFDGINDYVQTVLTPGEWPGVTVSLWVRLDALGSYPMLFSYPAFPGSPPELRFFSNSGLVEWIETGGNVGPRDSANLLGTGWHHIVGTSGGGVLKLYRNGNPVGASTVAHQIAGNGTARIGSRSSGSFFLTGGATAPSVWSRTLSADEVWREYDQSRRGYPDLLRRVRSWSFGVTTGNRRRRVLICGGR